MRKLKLEVQNLEIESFDTASAPSEKGTVEAYATVFQTDPCYTCGDTTCIGTHDGNVCTYNFTCRYTCERPQLTQESCPCYPEV